MLMVWGDKASWKLPDGIRTSVVVVHKYVRVPESGYDEAERRRNFYERAGCTARVSSSLVPPDFSVFSQIPGDVGLTNLSHSFQLFRFEGARRHIRSIDQEP